MARMQKNNPLPYTESVLENPHTSSHSHYHGPSASVGYGHGASAQSISHNTSHRKYLIFLTVLILITLAISLYAALGINSIKKSLSGQSINVADFLKKVTAHSELGAYKDVTPLNIIQINSGNLASLQGQISGLNVNHIGKFLIQYSDKIVLYDYAADQIENQVTVPQQPQLPADFFTKLYAHKEVAGLAESNPVGGVLDAGSLAALQQQFPQAYKDAKVGDFLLRYPQAVIVYDYQNDRLVNVVPLAQQQETA